MPWPTVTVSSSRRFADDVTRVVRLLRDDGVRVLPPDFDQQPREDRRLMIEHLEKVRACDVLYVVAVDGYVGRSVALEIGYAAAIGTPIYLSQQPTESGVAEIAAGIVPLHAVSAAALSPDLRHSAGTV